MFWDVLVNGEIPETFLWKFQFPKVSPEDWWEAVRPVLILSVTEAGSSCPRASPPVLTLLGGNMYYNLFIYIIMAVVTNTDLYSWCCVRLKWNKKYNVWHIPPNPLIFSISLFSAFFSLLLFRRTTFFVFNFLLSESIFQLVDNHGASLTEEPSVESVTITQNIQIRLSSVQ